MKITTNSFLGKIFQFKNVKILILQIIWLQLLLKKIISRLGPLVFHEYLLRFGKSKVIFAQFKSRQTNRIK